MCSRAPSTVAVVLRRVVVAVTAVVAVVAGAGCEAPEVAAPETHATLTPAVEAGPRTPGNAMTDGPVDPLQSRRAAELPGSRTEVTGATWGERVVAVGGLDQTGAALRNVDVYDPQTDSWSRGPDLPVALHHTAAATLDGRLYVVGGYSIRDGTWVPEAAVWSVGHDDAQWRREPLLGTARGALAVASTGTRLVAVGGVAPDGTVLTTTEVLESGAGGWVPGAQLGTAREHLAATAVDDEVYAIAGHEGGLATNRDSVEVLRDGDWRDGGRLNHARGGIGAATVQGMPCVTGGEEDGGTIASVECLINGAWEVVAALEVARHGLAVAALGGSLHVIGGGPEPRLTTSSVHEVVPVPAP